MLRASSRPLRTLFLVTGLAIVGFGGPAGCQTSHSPGFQKVRPERTAPAAPAAARPLPEGAAEGVPEHLLHEYAGRDLAPDAEIHTWDLPTKAKRVVVELLILAARDDASHLDTIMTQQARWGAPDRREYDARPVTDGKDFLDVLRQASSRFARKQNLTCPPIMPPAAQVYVRNGSEPMWCFYGSNDGLDILAFKLVVEGGSAKIDYVGMYAERPTRMIPRSGSQPPPMTPMVRRGPRMPNPNMPNPNMPGLNMPGPNMPGLEGGQPLDPNALPGGVIINGQPGAPQPGIGADAGQPGGQPGQPAGSPDQPGAPAGTIAGQNPGTTAQPTGTAGQPPGLTRGQPVGPTVGGTGTASTDTKKPTVPKPVPKPATPKPVPKPATPKPATAAEPSGSTAGPAGAAPPAP